MPINRTPPAGCDDFLPEHFRDSDLIAQLALHLSLTWTHPEPTPITRATPEDLAALLAAAGRGELSALRRTLANLRSRFPSDPHLANPDHLAQSYRLDDLHKLLAQKYGRWGIQKPRSHEPIHPPPGFLASKSRTTRYPLPRYSILLLPVYSVGPSPLPAPFV